MARETILSIVGLDCPNCAAKVERKIGEMPEIMEATIDFLGEKLFITTEEENRNSLIEKIQEVLEVYHLFYYIDMNITEKDVPNVNQTIETLATYFVKGLFK